MINSELVYVVQWFMRGFKANFNFNLVVNKLTAKVPGCSSGADLGFSERGANHRLITVVDL